MSSMGMFALDVQSMGWPTIIIVIMCAHSFNHILQCHTKHFVSLVSKSVSWVPYVVGPSLGSLFNFTAK